MLTTMFATDHREWKDNVKHWKAIKSLMFAILLQHCPRYLTQQIKSNGRYEDVNESKDAIALITMICDVAHQHDGTTQGTMALLTGNLSLYTTFITSEDDTEAFYGVFNAMADTINVHCGSDWYYPQLYADHFYILFVERMLDPMTISKDELEKVQKDAKNSACEEYFSRLFILVAYSGRFQGLNRALDNQFLLDKDAYPTTMPQSLNLLEYFKAEVGTTPKGRADSGDDYSVAFSQAQI